MRQHNVYIYGVVFAGNALGVLQFAGTLIIVRVIVNGYVISENNRFKMSPFVSAVTIANIVCSCRIFSSLLLR